MKLLVTYDLESWLGFTHKCGFLYQHKAIVVKPLDMFADFTPYLIMDSDHVDRGYGAAIRISKPMNIKHDTFMCKFRRFKAKL